MQQMTSQTPITIAKENNQAESTQVVAKVVCRRAKYTLLPLIKYHARRQCRHAPKENTKQNLKGSKAAAFIYVQVCVIDRKWCGVVARR